MNWQSQHASGLPIVNSPIVSFVESDIPAEFEAVHNSQISDFPATNQDLVFPVGTIFPRGLTLSDDFVLTNGTIPTIDGERLAKNHVLTKDIVLRNQLTLARGYELVDQLHITSSSSSAYLFPGATQSLDLSQPGNIYRVLQIFDEDDRLNPYDRTPNDPTDDWIGLGSSVSVDFSSFAADCFPVEFPAFQLRVRELWPDNGVDRDKILRLFGADSLDWWTSLSTAEQRHRTEGRRLAWWPNLSMAEQDARVAALTEIVPCDTALPTWCRWLPTRRGYFEVTLESAWLVEKFNRRGWVNPQALQILDQALSATNTDVIERTAVRASVRSVYERIGLIIGATQLSPERLLDKADAIQAWLIANVPAWDPPPIDLPTLIYYRYSLLGVPENKTWDLEEAENFIAGRWAGNIFIGGKFRTKLDDFNFHLNASGLRPDLVTSYTNISEVSFASTPGIDGDGTWDGGFIQAGGSYPETLIWLQRQTANWMGIEISADGTPTGIMDFPVGISPRGTNPEDIEFLYAQSDRRFWCPTLDVRVECGQKRLHGAFVPSGESVGILVNELRVSSRTPTE